MFRKLICAALAAAVGAALTGCGKKTDGAGAVSIETLYAEQGMPVTVRTLGPEDFSVYSKYATVLHAESESTVYASVGDIVRSVNAHVGDTVKRDQVVVSFSSDNKTLQQAGLNFESAASAWERSRALYNNKDISRQDYDTVRTQYELARTNLDAARDAVFVKAPIAGKITNLSVNATLNVRPGDPLFTVSGEGGYKGRFYVGADEIEKVRGGARVFIDGMDASIEGRVTQVSLLMDAVQQAFTAAVSFDSNDRRLVNGLGVDINVEVYHHQNAIVVSRTELLETERGFTAFVAEGDCARAVPVETGAERDLLLEITSGLKAGDTLICDGLRHLADGTKILATVAVAQAVASADAEAEAK